MPVTKYDRDRLVGVLLRRLVGDILRQFDKNVLERIFTNEQGKLDDLGKSCKDWSFNISAYMADIKKKKLYQDLLIILQDEGINPDQDELWKLLMKREMPLEFFTMFDDMKTQIPRVAIRDKSEPKSKEDEETWFQI